MTVHYGSDGTVTVRGIGRLNFRNWVNQMRAAIRIVTREGGSAPSGYYWARRWLLLHDLKTREAVEGMSERLAKLDEPGDPSNIIRCSRCGAALSDPVSKLYRMGPECRKQSGPSKGVVFVRRELHAEQGA